MRAQQDELVNSHDSKNGRTPLLEACLMNRKDVVISLIENMNAGMCLFFLIY